MAGAAPIILTRSLVPFTVQGVLQPSGTENLVRPYRAFLGSTGANSGTTDMAVDGYPTPQTFYLGANPNVDLVIQSVRVLIGFCCYDDDDDESGGDRADWGNVSQLSTGFDLLLEDGPDTVWLAEKAKTFGHLLAWADVPQNGLDFGELDRFTRSMDVQVAHFNLSNVSGGFRIGRGTDSTIKAVVRDDIDALDMQYVQVVGYAIMPSDEDGTTDVNPSSGIGGYPTT